MERGLMKGSAARESPKPPLVLNGRSGSQLRGLLAFLARPLAPFSLLSPFSLLPSLLSPFSPFSHLPSFVITSCSPSTEGVTAVD